MWKSPRTHKYGAKEVWYDGIRFPSIGEGNRYLFLRDEARAGRISDLRLQVHYELYPAVFEQKTITRGPRKGETVNSRLLEEGITYVADFVYRLPDGREVVEDFKGMQTPVFKIKRRLMRERLGIRVHIVTRPCAVPGSSD